MAYIGSSAAPIPVNFSAVQSQGFNGTGSQTAFTMARSVATPSAIEVLVNNVQQSPFDGSYTVLGATLTFSEAPSTGTNNVYVIYRDQPIGSLIDIGAVRKSGDAMSGSLSTNGASAMSSASLVAGRTHTILEGGQLDLCRASDNTSAFAIDVYGDGNNPSMRIIDTVNGIVRMAIDGAGKITKPNQPAFWGMSNTTSSGKYINFSGNLGAHYLAPGLINRGGHFDAANGRFTAPVSGVYSISLGIHSNSSGRKILALLKNGAWIGEACEAVGDYEDQCMSLLIALVAGDYLEAQFNASFAAFNASFSGHLIG